MSTTTEIRASLRGADGGSKGDITLPGLFGEKPREHLVYEVVHMQQATRRAGTHATKTRAFVSGGGAKPWRQKGTGRARQGSTRAPHWRGGGVALGPKPRNYVQRTPKKMIRLALASALSDRAAEGRVVVVEDFTWTEPKTTNAIATLAALGVDGRVLVVLTVDDEIAWKSFRNLQNVHILTVGELNAYDVLASDWVLFTSSSLPAAKES